MTQNRRVGQGHANHGSSGISEGSSGPKSTSLGGDTGVGTVEISWDRYESIDLEDEARLRFGFSAPKYVLVRKSGSETLYTVIGVGGEIRRRL